MTGTTKRFICVFSGWCLLPAWLAGGGVFAQTAVRVNDSAEGITNSSREFSFIPQIRPLGFEKNQALSLYPQNGRMAILDDAGRFTPLGRYLWSLARNPQNMERHFNYLFSRESGNWPWQDSPLYAGPVPLYQGHRLPRLLLPFTELIRQANEIPETKKTNLMNQEWVVETEAMFRQMINDDGLLAEGTNVATMALSFHFLRTGFEAMKLRPEHIYTLPKAQMLVRTLLTKPYILNDKDQWLKASQEFIARCKEINRDTHYPADAIEIRGDEVFFQGGLFIGWKTTLPSLHATWDALVILNTLFSYYPEPDPASPKSIFYLWNQEPEAKRQAALSAIKLLSRKLWLDYQEQKGRSYCWVVDGQVTRGSEAGPEVPQLFDHAGYSRSNYNNWASACWEEMFGNPMKNANNGVQALLAIADGRVSSVVKQPVGEQKRPADFQ